jgi:nucleoside-diphosphate-sugar epimerase
MKILITGANGYIGETLNKAFKNKHDITLLTRQIVDLYNSNQVKEFFKEKYFDVVIHCAIKGGGRLDVDDSNTLDTNLKMYYNLVENEMHFNKLIHFGSGAERQNTFYGLSKKVINESIKNKDKFHNIRILNVFDENELYYKFIKSNIKKYINNQDLEIFQNKYMDFFYMHDFITLIDYCINNDIPKVIDCSYNYLYTLYDVAQIINNLDNHKVNIVIKDWLIVPPFNGEFTDLGLKFIGLEQGIKNVYNIIKNEY